MIRDRLSLFRDRVRRKLIAAFATDHSPHEIALSFSIGTFVAAMPTGGLGVGVLFGVAYWFSWANKAALFAAVVVVNPLVKPFVYVLSYKLGALLLGTDPLVEIGHETIDLLFAVGQLLLIGNVLIGLFLSVLGYLTVFHLANSHRRREGSQPPPSFLTIGFSLFDRGKR